MQISKKLYTTIIITILTLSTIMAAIPMASAEIITPPQVVNKGGTTDVTGGPVGTEVDVVGNSTTGAASPFSTVSVYWDALSGLVLGTGSADINGVYRITVTIPPATNGTHYLVVNDGETESSGKAFAVSPTISADVTKALPGDSVTVIGHGYASNDDIVLTLNSTTLGTPYSDTITVVPTTNGTGSFSVTFVVPTMATTNFDVYSLNGTDEASNMASTTININYYITLTPATGPTGITTTISGRIKASVAYTITFNSAQIATGTTDADGSYSTAYTIPGVLSPASYPVVITWETSNTRTAQFTVTTPPTISLGATSGISGAVVTITGSGFSGAASITLYLGTTVVNSTALDSRFGKTSSGGTFSEDFTVPALAPGIYAVSVVDQYGATSTAGVFFTINATPVFMVATRATAYVRMDFISLVSQVTTAVNVDLVFTDPTGLEWYRATVSASAWQSIGIYSQIPPAVVTLTWWPITSDAPIGTWNFTCYAASTTTILDTNLFTVVAKPTQQDVLDQLDTLAANLDTMEASIKSVVTTTEGDIIAVINTKTGTITAELNTLEAAIVSIAEGMITISTSLGEVQVDIAALDLTALNALGVDITAIKGNVATIKTNLGTVTTAVSNLDAKVTALSGDVATVSTTLGTLQGTVTAIDGKVATIDTSIGTVQADISDVSAKVDTTPAWIAVVLALVAAVAAIFAVITIRQKIAG